MQLHPIPTLPPSLPRPPPHQLDALCPAVELLITQLPNCPDHKTMNILELAVKVETNFKKVIMYNATFIGSPDWSRGNCQAQSQSWAGQLRPQSPDYSERCRGACSLPLVEGNSRYISSLSCTLLMCPSLPQCDHYGGSIKA